MSVWPKNGRYPALGSTQIDARIDPGRSSTAQASPIRLSALATTDRRGTSDSLTTAPELNP